jgi:hypothetical protein
MMLKKAGVPEYARTIVDIAVTASVKLGLFVIL